MKTRFLHHLALPDHLALPAIFVSMAFASSWPAQAQTYGIPMPMRPSAPIYAPNMPTHPMPFREVALMLHRFGFQDIARIEQRGETYRIAASDRSGLPVMIMIDAYDGDILDVRPVGVPSRPGPHARSGGTAKIITVVPNRPELLKPELPKAAARQVLPKPPQRNQATASLAGAKLPAQDAPLALRQMAAGRIYPPVEADMLRNLPAGSKR